MSENTNELTQEEVKHFLSYDPITGEFKRLYRGNMKFNNPSPAGTINNGYLRIKVKDVKYAAHRLAWLYMTGNWPKDCIDHIDGNPSNNVFSNLRECSRIENQRNCKKPKNNTSGVKGVFAFNGGEKWQAGIGVNGKLKHLGLFDNKEDAIQARINAANEIFGEFANHG